MISKNFGLIMMKNIIPLIYILIIFPYQKGTPMIDKEGGPIVGLNQQEKVYLLELARKTIQNLVEKGDFPETKPISEKVQQNFGVFVTLNKNGHLRGCIGFIEGVKPLYKVIMEMAKSAAFNDPRFPPVKAEEVSSLEIEISVLSPLKKIKDVKEIEVGKHGIIIQRGFYRGLLLPQVATEWGWNREEFLAQTCHKAGLPTDAWKDPDTEIQIFSAEIFSEKDFHKQ